MRKTTKLPREQLNDDGLPNRDGLPTTDSDVEGHGGIPERLHRLPGTGGDRLGTGGKTDEPPEFNDDNDVEGHGLRVDRLPGTGGDAVRRPSDGGE